MVSQQRADGCQKDDWISQGVRAMVGLWVGRSAGHGGGRGGGLRLRRPESHVA